MTGEAVYRGHDRRHLVHRPFDACALAHVANDDVDGSAQVTCTITVTGQHAHIETARQEARHDDRAETAGTTCDENHPRTT